jgi:hypothetical protein
MGVAAATAEYAPTRPGSRPTRLILVRYASPAVATTAASTFSRAYLPEVARTPAGATDGSGSTEQGVVAWSVQGSGLAIVLDAESAALARTLASRVAYSIPPPDAKRQ